MPNTRFDELVINEVSLVPSPANKGARVAIFKADEDPEKDQLAKGAFMEALAGLNAERQIRETMDQMWDINSALRRSIRNIMADKDIQNKQSAIKEAISEFITTLTSLANAMGGQVNKDEALLNVAMPLIEAALDSGNKEGDNMGKENQAAKENEVTKAVKKENEDLKAQLAKAKAIVKLSDVAKAHYESLSVDEADAFLKMDANAQQVVLDDIAKQDETYTTVHGTVLRKSRIGPEVFETMKMQDKEIKQGREDLQKEQEARLDEVRKGKVENLYKHVPGSEDEKVSLLKAMDGLGQEDKSYLEGLLKQLDEAILTLTKIKGVEGDRTSGASEDKLNAMAKEIQKAEGITFEKAYTKAIRSPEGREIYQEMENAG
jgi:hypothetical protein